ncbi:MAG: ABC transporter ATP-binding protein [Acidimicrobiales bacterium]|jgi:ABC-type sugar transport system ATPase subunit
MSEVVFEGITKRFGDVTAVDQLSLEVCNEEFMVLLGPSGCGKTTALRMVAGLETITEGTLRIGGRVVNDVEAKDRNVSMVFQSYALYPHMTVAKNIESPLIARKFAVDGGPPRKLHKAERRARVEEAARTLGLTELLDRKPAALSGGQRQRVALARAIVSRPAAFLMDEPLSNLDAKLRAQTRLELVDLHERLATTFLYVTHDQIEAMTMATRIAILNDGRLQQVGPPQAVYERPHNLFVARFIGSPPMNTVEGTFVVEAGEAFVDLGGAGRFRVRDVGGEPVAPGTRVVVGVRPEHLVLGDAAGSVEGTVVAVEWLGHERHVVCEVAGAQVIIREPSEGAGPKAGERVRIGAVGANAVHLFDPDTTERLN